MTLTGNLFAAAQGALGVRAFSRMLGTAAGDAIAAVDADAKTYAGMTAIVPVLDERSRLGPALEGLIAQPSGLRQILIVDGGSTDGTQDMVREFAARDSRVVLVEAGAPADGWNGKIWNLAAGLAASDPNAEWIVTMDADVRPAPHFTASILAHAATSYVDAFSAAPAFVLSGAAEAVVHPAFLATLVYRYGLPGNVARSPQTAQANGQCFVAKRALLVSSAVFERARASRCEDVTIARTLVAAGAQVGFYEAGSLAVVEMYASAAECFANWPRSLPMRDETTPFGAIALALCELAFVQALPLVAVLATLARRGDTSSFFFRLNLALLVARVGVLAGTERAYRTPSPAYWLSPFADVPVVLALVRSTLRRTHVWRGRTLVAEGAAA